MDLSIVNTASDIYDLRIITCHKSVNYGSVSDIIQIVSIVYLSPIIMGGVQ